MPAYVKHVAGHDDSRAAEAAAPLVQQIEDMLINTSAGKPCPISPVRVCHKLVVQGCTNPLEAASSVQYAFASLSLPLAQAVASLI